MEKSPYVGPATPLSQFSKTQSEALSALASHIIPKTSSIKVPPIHVPAKWMYERLCMSINDFEKELDSDHEIGARLVSFGSSITFHIDNLGYWGPDIIKFYGTTDDGNRVELIQHISQLSVLLIAVQKREEKARRIGFGLVKDIKED